MRSSRTLEGVVLMALTLLTSACAPDLASEGETGDESGPDTGPDMGSDTGDEQLPPPCDPWAPACAANEKCVPWASEAGDFSDDRCVPVEGAGQPGQLCQWDGVGVGTDDCDATSFCWHHDASGDGICRELCHGTPGMPSCDGEGTFCAATGEVDNLCLLRCEPLVDPLVSECLPGEGCYLAVDVGVAVCLEPSDTLEIGEVCGLPSDCVPGLTCVPNVVLDDCAGASCCTPWCFPDTDDELCASYDPDYSCQPLFNPGGLPPYPIPFNVGLCALPG